LLTAFSGYPTSVPSEVAVLLYLYFGYLIPLSFLVHVAKSLTTLLIFFLKTILHYNDLFPTFAFTAFIFALMLTLVFFLPLFFYVLDM
jgi:hypothetical protein